MNSPLRWFLVALGMLLNIGGFSAVNHFRDEATRLTEADVGRSDYRAGDFSRIYNTHLAEMRGDRIFFNVVEYGGLILVCFSVQIAKKIPGKSE